MRALAIFLSAILLAAINTSAQVGINTDGSAPNNSAMLEVKSTNRGMLPPRMTTAQRNAIVSPVIGLLIYNTDCNDMQFYNGSRWIPLAGKGGLSAPVAVNGNLNPCVNSAGNSYSVAAVAGATGYHWTVPSGATIASGQGTNTVSVTFGTQSGPVCVAAVNECYRSEMKCLDINVLPTISAGVSIETNANPVCAGTLVTFTATPVNGGTSPLYQWKKNGSDIVGATNFTYSYIPANGDNITCLMTSNAPCVTTPTVSSNTISMIVIPTTPVSITITPLANPLCSGSTVTFTSSIVNGGTSPQYQWIVDGYPVPGANYNSFTYGPLTDNDQVICVLTSNVVCATGNPATSNVVNLVVNPILTPGVTILASKNPTCAGSSVTFTATPANGGNAPTFQWNKNGLNISGATSASYSYIPEDEDSIKCVMTSGATCLVTNQAESNSIAMNVQTQVTSVCYGEPIRLYAACRIPGTCLAGTYIWQNQSGSWSSSLADPVIYPGQNGYATDEFILAQQCANPPGSFYMNSINITVLPPIDITGEVTPVTCPGQSDGTITLTVSGGTPPYSFVWSDGVISANRTGLSSGEYSVTVTDANGCTAEDSRSVGTLPPTECIVRIELDSVYQCGDSLIHLIAVTQNCGENPTYLWLEDWSPVADNDSVRFSTHYADKQIRCVVTPDLACPSSPFSEGYLELQASLAVQSQLCYGWPIQLNCPFLTQGCGAYGSVYTWSNASGTWSSSLSDPTIYPGDPGYASDVFTLEVSHYWGSIRGMQCISVLPPITGNPSVTNVSCFGGNNGAVTLNPSGQNPPFSVFWSNGDTSLTRTNLSAGQYAVTITDNIGCQANEPIVITSPPMELQCDICPENTTCFSNCDGTVALYVIGGVPPYSISWSGPYGFTSQGDVLVELCPGTYTVTVTDQNGCTSSQTCNIASPPEIVVDETITYLTAAGNCDGAISLQVSGGFPPYNFYWYGPNGFASSSPNISGLCEGWYYLDLYDNNNCETTDQYFVEHNTCIPVTVNHIAGDVAPVSKSVTYSTVTNIPGEPDKCWITSNLGADHQAVSVDDSTEASAGWYWQFNRKQGYKHDGLSLTPWWFIGGIFFEDSDWLSSNDPCNLELGALWRLPTNTEFYNVNNVGGWTSWNGPWNSGLKLHAAGMLLYDNGFLLDRGIYGVYWSSTQNSSLYGCNLLFYSTSSATNFNVKASGFSVRCLKDN